jgi:AcrR family transcriptional regulator
MARSSTRRNSTRQRLYEAAVTLIAEQGFSSTTVEQIAERAGVAKGTVYYNFAGKAELFEELLRHGVGPVTETLRESARSAAARGGDTVDALDAMAAAGLGLVHRNPAFTRLLFAELWRTRRTWHPALLAGRRRVTEVVEEVLHEGVKSGELSEALDVPLTAGVLVGMVVVGALDWQSFHPERPLAEVHATLSLLLRGRIAAAGDTGTV